MARRRRRRRVLGTTERGQRKIYSQEQMGYLHSNRIDHTHFVWRSGRLVRKKRHTY